MLTRLPLAMPPRGLPSAKPRLARSGQHPNTILKTWEKFERRFYPAVLALRARGHTVWRVSAYTHQFDGKQVSTPELIALSRAKLGDSNGQGPQEIRQQEKVENQVWAQPAVPR